MDKTELIVSSPGDVVRNFQEHQDEIVLEAARYMIKDVEDYLMGVNVGKYKGARAWSPGKAVNVRLSKSDGRVYDRACEYTAELYRQKGWQNVTLEKKPSATFLKMDMPSVVKDE